MKNRKLMVSIIVLMLLWSGITGAIAGVVSNNDRQTTSTDSTIIIDYDDSYIRIDNITIGGVDIDGSTPAFSITSSWMNLWNLSTPSLAVIRNSNNNWWTVTEANLELAINDVGTDGTVWIGADMNKAITINMSGHDNVIIHLMGHTMTMTANVPFINFTGVQGSSLINGRIIPSTYHTTDIILFHCGQWDWQTAWEKRVYDCTIQNIDIVESSGYTTQHNWTGIHFNMNNHSSMQHNTVKDVYMYGAGTGIKININGTGLTVDEVQNAYMNKFHISNVYVRRHINGIWFIDDGTSRYSASQSGGANSWYFEDIMTQCPHGAIYTENPKIYGIRNITGGGHTWNHLIVYDWAGVVNKGNSVWIGEWGQDTDLSLSMDWDDQTGYCLDEGIETKIQSNNGNPYASLPYDYIVFQNSTHTFAVKGQTGVIGKDGSTRFVSTDAQYIIDKIVSLQPSSIFFKEGTYPFDDYVGDEDMHNMSFIGEDKNSVIFTVANVQLASGMFGCNARNNLSFSGITFDGSGATDSSRAIYLSTNTDVYGIFIDDCIFKNWVAGTSTAIFARPQAGIETLNIRITRTDFIDCDTALFFDSNTGGVVYAYVYGNYLKNCTMGFNLEKTNNSIFSDNTFVDGTTGINLVGSFNCSLHDNIFQDTTTPISVDNNDNIIKDNIGYNHNSLFPFYEQTTAPTIADNCTAYWYDTDGDYMYQIVNSYGSVWYINMSKTI